METTELLVLISAILLCFCAYDMPVISVYCSMDALAILVIVYSYWDCMSDIECRFDIIEVLKTQ